MELMTVLLNLFLKLIFIAFLWDHCSSSQHFLCKLDDRYCRFAFSFLLWTELQLKLEHKPMDHLHNWQRKIVSMLTGVTDTSKETPTLKWRRNAKVGVVSEEREVTHPLAIRTLFYEAKHNYINGLYPCKDHDVHTFASILILLEQEGKYDPGNAKSYLQ